MSETKAPNPSGERTGPAVAPVGTGPPDDEGSSPSPAAALTATGVAKAYGSLLVLAGVNLSVAAGEVVAVLGPSGCGKSTLLRVLAGLEPPDRGRVAVGGEAVRGPSSDRPMVVQGATLFPWLSLRANLEWGPRALGNPRAGSVVDELLEATGLDGYADLLPRQLSGGMRQRAAIAQVLANQPPLLLLDEPFGSLDAQTRLRMQEWLIGVLGERATATVLVTHDVEEALLLGHRLLRLSGRPATVLEEVALDLPRPRGRATLADPRFVELKAAVLARVLDA
ncbi:MAG TPA: ABC transporter ATP-binding protein [Acidimicrobiales bacterium]|nr:ABC transporter ATP-binding protein [Acidimicrobiales bacterium]